MNHNSSFLGISLLAIAELCFSAGTHKNIDPLPNPNVNDTDPSHIITMSDFSKDAQTRAIRAEAPYAHLKSAQIIDEIERLIKKSSTGLSYLKYFKNNHGQALIVDLSRYAGELRGYMNPTAGVIGIHSGLSLSEQVNVYAHELAHAAVSRYRVEPTRIHEYSPNAHLAEVFLEEAFVNAAALFIAYEVKQAGHPEAFEEHKEDSWESKRKMYRAFTDTIEEHGSINRALAATFDAWLDTPDSRNTYHSRTIINKETAATIYGDIGYSKEHNVFINDGPPTEKIATKGLDPIFIKVMTSIGKYNFSTFINNKMHHTDVMSSIYKEMGVTPDVQERLDLYNETGEPPFGKPNTITITGDMFRAYKTYLENQKAQNSNDVLSLEYFVYERERDAKYLAEAEEQKKWDAHDAMLDKLSAPFAVDGKKPYLGDIYEDLKEYGILQYLKSPMPSTLAMIDKITIATDDQNQNFDADDAFNYHLTYAKALSIQDQGIIDAVENLFSTLANVDHNKLRINFVEDQARNAPKAHLLAFTEKYSSKSYLRVLDDFKSIFQATDILYEDRNDPHNKEDEMSKTAIWSAYKNVLSSLYIGNKKDLIMCENYMDKTTDTTPCVEALRWTFHKTLEQDEVYQSPMLLTSVEEIVLDHPAAWPAYKDAIKSMNGAFQNISASGLHKLALTIVGLENGDDKPSYDGYDMRPDFSYYSYDKDTIDAVIEHFKESTAISLEP